MKNIKLPVRVESGRFGGLFLVDAAGYRIAKFNQSDKASAEHAKKQAAEIAAKLNS